MSDRRVMLAGLGDLCQRADALELPTPSDAGYMPTWRGTLAWIDPYDDHNLIGLEHDVAAALAEHEDGGSICCAVCGAYTDADEICESCAVNLAADASGWTVTREDHGGPRPYVLVVLTRTDGGQLSAGRASRGWIASHGDNDGWCNVQEAVEVGLLRAVHGGPGTYGHVDYYLTDMAMSLAGVE